MVLEWETGTKIGAECVAIATVDTAKNTYNA